MIARKLRTARVSKSEARAYLQKAGEYLTEAESALENNSLDSAGLLAIHAVISGADAVTGCHGRCRSTSPDHRDTVRILEEVVPQDIKERRKQIDRFRRIIGKKNIVAYEGRRLSAKEAAYLVEQSERFLNWVREAVPA
jgi:HEPN domain-containing protein